MSDPFDLSNYEPPQALEGGPEQPPAPTYLEELNDNQREAALTVEGPVLVLAGAGTGKTRVLITRLAHILATRRAFPGQILAVTFTNKAAREMVDRVRHVIGGAVEGLWIGTFHSIGARILRRHAEHVGLKPNFTILDTDDQLRLLKQILVAANVDEKRWPARALSTIINRWKDRGLTPDQISADNSGEFAGGRAADLYRLYQLRLIALNALDFGDLLLHCLTLFRTQPDVLADYHKRFRYILVDEYQDSNVAQYLWLRLLAQGSNNICCVGDDDQSIYGWRGAEVGNILRFEKDFEGAQIVRLERNYRSTPHILACASALIAQNQGRLGKTLWTQISEGEKVAVRGVWDEDAEARVVADETEDLQRKGHSLDEIAILVRASFQTRAFEERFLTLGIPYRVIGGPKFYERHEVRDALAYLRVVMVPEDDLAFERIVNVPKRGIGEASLQVLHRLARAGDMPLTQAAYSLVETDELRPQARRSLRSLVESFDRWRSLVSTMSHTELAETILDDSGYTAKWQNDRSPDAPGRLENLKELVRAIGEFETITSFLEHVSLVMDNNEAAEGDKANLMTLHAAKGLEFDTVFLPGWEEGLFPHRLSLDENGDRGLEEERRLAHVGLTRARHRVTITYAAARRVFGEMTHGNLPSRFIDELPDDHVEREANAGLFSGGADWSHGWGSGWFDGVTEDGESTAGGSRARYKRGRPDYGGRRSRYRGEGDSSGLVIEGTAEAVGGAHERGPLSPGQRIFHQKFGYGRIVTVEGNRLEVDFEKTAIKKIIASFVELA